MSGLDPLGIYNKNTLTGFNSSHTERMHCWFVQWKLSRHLLHLSLLLYRKAQIQITLFVAALLDHKEIPPSVHVVNTIGVLF